MPEDVAHAQAMQMPEADAPAQAVHMPEADALDAPEAETNVAHAIVAAQVQTPETEAHT